MSGNVLNEKNKKIILKKIVTRVLNIIKPNQVIGLGSGSTVAEFLEIFSRKFYFSHRWKSGNYKR